MRKNKEKGFTLVELIIIIAVIAVLVAVMFVALDPVTRFQKARDAVRQKDVAKVLSALKADQIDNDGVYIASVAAMAEEEVYMIVSGAMVLGCDDNNAVCDSDVKSDTHCVDLSALVAKGYLEAVPISPPGVVVWDGGFAKGQEGTGYTIQRDTTGNFHVKSCERESDTNPEVEAAQ